MASESPTGTNLDRSLVQGIAWTGAIRWGSQILSWIATFVIARLLTPDDYGLVGMAMIYVGLAQIVSEGGVAAAIVQQRDLNDHEVAQLSGLAVMIGVVLFVVTLALAAPMAWFFDEPQVYPVMLVFSSVFLVRSVQVVPRALMARDLNFRQLAWVDGTEGFFLMIVTVLLALAQFGYWALALGGVGSSILTTILVLKWRPQRIAFPRTIDAVRRPANFAWQVVTSQVAWYAYSNADFAVVGRVLGKSVLGAYSFAWSIASIPVDRVSGLVTRVTPAFFSAVQHDPPALRRYLLRLTEGLALVTLPACIGLAIVAPEFVQVFLGPAWTSAIVPLRLLSIYAAFRSVITPAPQILIATGHSRQSMYFSLLSVLILPPAFYIGAQWGAAGVAMGWILVYPILAIGLFLRYAFKIIGMTARQYLRALLPAAGATLAMTIVVVAVRHALPGDWPALARLLTQVLVGGVVYSAIILAVHGDRLRALHTLLRSKKGSTPAPDPNPDGLIHDSGGPRTPDRLLLISYHFPPDPAVGALRWRKLARYAAERGWGLDVITQHPSTLKIRDGAGLADLPPGVRVYAVPLRKVRIERPVYALWSVFQRFGLGQGLAGTGAGLIPRRESRARRDMGWWPRESRDLARAYFAFLEYIRYRQWAKDAARLALRLHEPAVHQAVVTCGPPHPVHAAGVVISRRARLPLVVDLRDPWSMVQRLPEATASPLGLWLARQGERTAVRQASLVVANTHPLRNAMRQAYPEASSRIITVLNGCDDDPVPAAFPNRRFTLAYAGTIYLDRDPRSLFRGVAKLVRDLGLTPSDLSIEFMGEYSWFDGVPLNVIGDEEGISEFIHTSPTGSRSEALQFMSRASLLVALPQDSDMAIPAKLFDYARFDARILAFAESGSAIDMLLSGTSADVVRPGDVDTLAEVLRKRYLQHLRGERGTRLSVDDRFTRRKQARVLFDALESIIGPARRPVPEITTTTPGVVRISA